MTSKSNFERATEARTIARGLPIDTSRTYTPAEAQAMLARLVSNPIPAINRAYTADADYGAAIGGLHIRWGGKSGYHVEDPRVEDQSAKPEKPETRYVTASTYGKTIPISMGKRRLEGNLILCSALVPKLVGNQDYTIEYEIPIYEDPPVDDEEGFTLDTSGGDIPDDPSDPPPETETCGKSDNCDTRDEEKPAVTEYWWSVLCGDLRYIEQCVSPDAATIKGGPYKHESGAHTAGILAAKNCYPGDHGGGRVGVYSREKSEDGSVTAWELLSCDVVATGPQ